VLDVPINIPQEVYDLIEGLLQTGKLEHDKFSLDLSEVQTIRIANGELSFSPPAKIQTKVGPIKVKTTISVIKSRSKGIHIDVDNSPIDVEVRPNE